MALDNKNFGATTVSNVKFYDTVTGETVFSGSGTLDLGSTFTFKTVKERTPMQKLGIDKITFNNPATIIHHLDGNKTVVKATDNDSFDPIYGFLLAYFQKTSGMTKTQANKFLDEVNELAVKQELVKSKKKDNKAESSNNKFKVGDRVLSVIGFSSGLTGTIKFNDKKLMLPYAVEFDEHFSGGHSCEGFGFKGFKSTRGYWLDDSYLELI